MSRHSPVVCTLTDAERKERGTTWQQVARTAVSAIEEREDGFVLTFNGDRATFEEIRNLVEAERRCCQWMTLDLQDGSPATLRIAADTVEGRAAIKRMLALL